MALAKKKKKYLDLDPIRKLQARYNIVFGSRSTGKSTTVLAEEALERYCRLGKQTALVRRWSEDFRSKRAYQMTDALVSNALGINYVASYSCGVWNTIYYYSGRWYLARRDEETGELTKDSTPFMFAFAVSAMEHDKSSSYNDITTIIFDEFITRSMYLPDEFILFENLVSTIVRDRDDVTIWMLGNSVSKYCPYFAEMGLKHVKEQQPGTIDLYEYGDSGLKVAVLFTGNREGDKSSKASDVYFAFDNPKLDMITGKGNSWEIGVYPHKPFKFKPNEILYQYFVEFDGEYLQCEIVHHDNCIITFVHRKSSDIKYPDKDLVFSPSHDPRPNWRRRINKPVDGVGIRIWDLFKCEKVYYADNTVGEIMHSYLNWCNSAE